MAANPWDGGEAGKFGVGLVEDDHRVASGVKNVAERGRFDQRAGRIVWIREEEDARSIQTLLRKLFPDWQHTHRYYKDRSTREPGWKVVITREPEDYDDKWHNTG